MWFFFLIATYLSHNLNNAMSAHSLWNQRKRVQGWKRLKGKMFRRGVEWCDGHGAMVGQSWWWLASDKAFHPKVKSLHIWTWFRKETTTWPISSCFVPSPLTLRWSHHSHRSLLCHADSFALYFNPNIFALFAKAILIVFPPVILILFQVTYFFSY